MSQDILWAVFIIVAGLTGVVVLKVIADLLTEGGQAVRATREQGGGLKRRLTGRLHNGHGEAHLSECHGLHLKVGRDGALLYQRKSKIVRHYALDK